jgi:hypothetical protein
MRARRKRAVAGLVLAAATAVSCLGPAAPTVAGAATAKPKPPSKAPSVPQDVTVVPGSGHGELVVSWSPPLYDGEYLNHLGVAVPYVITDYDIAGVPAASWATCVDLSLSCTLTGLRSGKTYEVGVRVYNAKGRHSKVTARVPGTPG